MRPNNYGLKSREMAKAASFALKAAAIRKELSFSTAATLGERFSQFAKFAKENGIKWLEHVDRSLVQTYGRELAERVQAGKMSPAYAQTLVSAINTVMALVTGGRWESVSPTKDCGIAERSSLRELPPGALDRQAYGKALEAIRSALGERVASVVELCRELGLRSKEASLINARVALQEAQERGFVTILRGTKGGRERSAQIASERQLEALQRAAEAQGTDRALIPANQNWKGWREGPLRAARELVQEHTGGGLHDLRAAYACERYAQLTGHAAPVVGGRIENRQADREAREIIAQELGHGRIDVVAEYIGGR